MKKLLALCFLLRLFAFGQAATPSGLPVAVNQSGQPIGSALVSICQVNPGTGSCAYPVLLYTDSTLTYACTGTLQTLNNSAAPTVTTGCSNPGYTDQLGNVVAYAPSGPYWCQYSGPTIVTYSQPCQFSGTGSVLIISYPNSSDGTACHELAQIDQTPGATTNGYATTASGTQSAIVGVVQAGCGTSGNAALVLFGRVQVLFDSSSITLGDAVGISAGSPGSATDLGSANPSSAPLGIIGTIILAPITNALPSACTISPGCWILFTALGSGGSGGSSANAVVTNPATNSKNTIVPTVSTVIPVTASCPVSAIGSVPCLYATNSSGAQVLAALQSGQVQLGSSATAPNIGSGTTSNTDWGGILTASSSTATYTFTGTYTNHPLCFGIDLTSGHTGYLVPTYTGTTSVSFTTGGTTDTVQYHCPSTK